MRYLHVTERKFWRMGPNVFTGLVEAHNRSMQAQSGRPGPGRKRPGKPMKLGTH